LPLLTQEKWYTRVKRGYARGWEPVRFVENIRGYIDILDWVATDSGPPAQREGATPAPTATTAATMSDTLPAPAR
jgi:membrane-bound lytic murein transglycosylase F